MMNLVMRRSGVMLVHVIFLVLGSHFGLEELLVESWMILVLRRCSI